MGKEGGRDEDAAPLFETKEGRFRGAYKVFASTVFVGICLIWVYRLTHIPTAAAEEDHDDDDEPLAGRYWAWIGVFMAELCFGLYWIVSHHPFKQMLSKSPTDPEMR
jgi:hypothetical protein